MAIPRGSSIFVTGATGSVGGAVTAEILRAGYTVKAMLRSKEKAAYLGEAYAGRYGSHAIEVCFTENLCDSTALLREMEGCSGVVHTASDISASPDADQVVGPTLKSVEALLEAALRTPTVKRFIYTSSLATLPRATEAIDIGPSSWAPDSVIEVARAGPQSGLSDLERGLAVYAASKMLAERACWDFVRERNPHFVLNTVVPFSNIGAFVHPRLVSSFNGLVLATWLGDTQASAMLQMVERQSDVLHLVNLEDCGLLHLAGLMLEDVQGERILAVGEPFTCDEILDVMRKMDPLRSLPKGSGHKSEVKATINKARCKELLVRMGKKEPTGLEESVKQAIRTGAPAT